MSLVLWFSESLRWALSDELLKSKIIFEADFDKKPWAIIIEGKCQIWVQLKSVSWTYHRRELTLSSQKITLAEFKLWLLNVHCSYLYKSSCECCLYPCIGPAWRTGVWNPAAQQAHEAHWRDVCQGLPLLPPGGLQSTQVRPPPSLLFLISAYVWTEIVHNYSFLMMVLSCTI